MSSVAYGEGLYGAGTYGHDRFEVAGITLDGVAVPLDGVLADVTIRHGRAGYFDSASPSTAQITLVGVSRSFTKTVRLGAVLVITATDGATVAPRFTGRLTDADLVGDGLTLIAVGRLRTLSGYTVGNVAYPEETWTARVARAVAEAGRNLLSNPSMETDIAGWYAFGGAVTLSRTASATAYSGFAHMRVDYPAANAAAATTTPTGLALPAGTSVTSSAWLKGTAGQKIEVHVLGRTTDAVAFGGWTEAVMTGDWQRVAYTGSVPAGKVGDVIELLVFKRGVSGNTFPDLVRVDEASVEISAAATGLSGQVLVQVGAFNPVLVARPIEPVTLSQYLDELAATVEASVADLPDGRILVQAVGWRTNANIVQIDPAEVAYAPDWEMRLPTANIVTVRYGAPEAAVTVQDATSVALYGPITADGATEIKTALDATALGNGLLARRAYGRWTLPDAALLYGRRLGLGSLVGLSMLPAEAPYGVWAPVLEGWTDSIVSDGAELVWTMALALSDPMLSGLSSLSWASVPATAAYQWNTIDQAVAWRDALALSDLDP